MNTLDHILKKFLISYTHETRMPIEIPNYGRDNLAELFNELGFERGVEVGTEQGVYAKTLLDKGSLNLQLDCVDAWTAYRGYRDHTRQEKLNRFYDITKERLFDYIALGRCALVREFSMDAVKHYEDNSLDFVYIDGNHDFINVAQDVYYWSKKVRPGGIVAGHDYVKRKDEAAHVHVKQVMSGYTDAYNIKPWFVLGTDAKVEGQIRDSSRSWMFIKS